MMLWGSRRAKQDIASHPRGGQPELRKTSRCSGILLRHAPIHKQRDSRYEGTSELGTEEVKKAAEYEDLPDGLVIGKQYSLRHMLQTRGERKREEPVTSSM